MAETFTGRNVRRCSDPNQLGCRQEAEPRKQRCYDVATLVA